MSGLNAYIRPTVEFVACLTEYHDGYEGVGNGMDIKWMGEADPGGVLGLIGISILEVELKI